MFLGVEAQLRIHPPEDVALLSETEMLPSLPEIKLPHTEKSLVLAEVRRIFTTRQRSCEKLMFSVVSICSQGEGSNHTLHFSIPPALALATVP